MNLCKNAHTFRVYLPWKLWIFCLSRQKNKSPGRGIFWEADVAGPGREPARCEAWETRAGIFSFTQEIQTNLNI